MNSENKKAIFEGKICPYCEGKTDYVDSSIVYNGKSFGMIYLCKPCRAWVGVHEGTDNALGRLANNELREYKKRAHAAFDPIWKTKSINNIWKEYLPKTSNREKAYIWLSKQLGIKRENCHIGFFNVNICKRVILICNSFSVEK